jgi:hypothetical protein
MTFLFYTETYRSFIESNFPFVEYLQKLTPLSEKDGDWRGLCPVCENPNFVVSSPKNYWHCPQCNGWDSAGDRQYYTPAALLTILHNMEFHDVIIFMEGWLRINTDLAIPTPKFEEQEIAQVNSVEELIELCETIGDDRVLDADHIEEIVPVRK